MEQDLKKLQHLVDGLIQTCDRLHEENRSLRQQVQGASAERASLLEKHEIAKGRVEAMIARLRALEHGT